MMKLFLITSTLLVLSACNMKKAPVEAESKPFETGGVNSFELEKYDFRSNRLFFWKKDAPVDQIKIVMENAAKIDGMESDYLDKHDALDKLKDSKKRELESLTEEKRQVWEGLESQHEEIMDRLPKLDLRIENQNKMVVKQIGKVDELQTQRSGLVKAQEEIQKQLDEELAKEPGSQNPEKIAKLKADLQSMVDELAKFDQGLKAEVDKKNKLEATLVKLKTDKENLSKDKQTIEDAMAQFPNLSLLVQQIKAADKELVDLGDKNTPVLKECTETIMANVDYFSTARQVVVDLLKETPEILVAEWDLGDGRGALRFSTQEGTIKNVSYRDSGGLLTFDLIDSQDTFSLKLERNSVPDRAGRKLFSGSIVKSRNGEILARGIAKFVDRNLN